MLINYKVLVKGKVQGVWFRKYTKEKANELQLKGFVRNESDGSVYAEAEGEKAALTEFVDWLHVGSPLSKVISLTFESGELQQYSSFEIRR